MGYQAERAEVSQVLEDGQRRLIRANLDLWRRADCAGLMHGKTTTQIHSQLEILE